MTAAEEASRRWGGGMPFEAMVGAASGGDWRLLRVSMVRGEEGERRYLSLGHDALAKVAAEFTLAALAYNLTRLRSVL